MAETYDRLRPSYPAATAEAVIDFAGRPEAALEVGAGTGKASVVFAERGLRLTCLEPDAAMAAVARRRLEGLQAVVVEQSFEDWTGGGSPLCFAAQSWHWIRPEVRVAKAHAALAPGGTLALMWNGAAYPDGELRVALDLAYGGLLPDARPWRSGGGDPEREANHWAADELEASDLFGPVTTDSQAWRAGYTTEEWVGLLSTQSDHRMLDDDARRRLLERIAEVVDANGGSVEVDYTTTTYLAIAGGPGADDVPMSGGPVPGVGRPTPPTRAEVAGEPPAGRRRRRRLPHDGVAWAPSPSSAAPLGIDDQLASVALTDVLSRYAYGDDRPSGRVRSGWASCSLGPSTRRPGRRRPGPGGAARSRPLAFAAVQVLGPLLDLLLAAVGPPQPDAARQGRPDAVVRHRPLAGLGGGERPLPQPSSSATSAFSPSSSSVVAPDPPLGELVVLEALDDLATSSPSDRTGNPNWSPSGTPYSPCETTASEVQSPAAVG